MRKLALLFCGWLLSVAESVLGADVLEKYHQLPPQQLIDTADSYFRKGANDTALFCYSIVINTPVSKSDVERQKLTITALNKSAIVYYWMCDYRQSYEFLIKALALSEQYNCKTFEYKIYVNLGNIYYRLAQYDMAERYSLKALELCDDTVDMVILSNNIGSIELEHGDLDKAFRFLEKADRFSRLRNNIYDSEILHNKALFYMKKKQHDSSFKYVRLSLSCSDQNNELKAASLSDLSKLFFETGKMDSALYYIAQSNRVASEGNGLDILTKNYLILSEIEETKGNRLKAFEWFKIHSKLKDSINDADKLGEISQLQRSYEVSKTNRQIEQFVMEQQLRERTIRYRTISLWVAVSALILVSLVLLVVFFQNKKLNKAYKVLVEKNLQIMKLYESSPKKKEKVVQSENVNSELLAKILTVMEDTSVICDTEFSLDKLSMLVQSNHSSVSQAINTGFNKNFRSFLNGYRIEEAQRILSLPDAAKYTMEAVALKVGFKSRTGFSSVFKEITGVSPNFYMKSLREQAGMES